MELRRVDPARPHGPVVRAAHRVARSRAGRWYGIHVAAPVDAFLLRHTGGRARLVGPLPTATLATVGARSGLPREKPLVYFHDGEDVVLVASSFGRDKHPAWYHNLVAHPDCELNGLPFRATEVTDPEDYERLFALAVRVYPGYADYRVRTSAIGRRIPLMRLTPRP
jgi:deazaflavin-dependent oxidoreductase (nitroreductase family)